MRIPALTAIWIFIVCISHAIGQESDIYTAYGIDEGLPQSSIWSIIQDKNGFLWVGTSDGVCRFDGYNFNVYRNNPDDSNSIVGGLYFRFYMDSCGAMWTISQNGISLYNNVKDNFTKIFFYQEKHPSDNYNCIFGEDAQFIWAGISAHGLLKIDKRSHKTTIVNDSGYENSNPLTSWQSGFVSKGKIWISNSNANCYVYDISKGKTDKTDATFLYKMVDFNDSEVLAASADGLLLVNKNDLTHKAIPLVIPGRQGKGIRDIFITSPSEVLLACSVGLIYIDPRTWKITKYTQSFARDKKYSYAYVHCIYRDRSGNLWFGTNGDGLKKMTAPYKKFRFYSSHSDSGNIVKAIYADRTRLYVGYYGNSLDVFDRKNGFVKNVALQYSSVALKHIYAITAADSSTLLLHAANQNMIYSYPLSGGKPSPFSPGVSNILPGYERITNVYPFFLKSGHFVYSDLADYLISFDVSAAKVKPFIVHQFTGEMLTCAFKDSKRTMWAGSINGAFYLDGNASQKVMLPEIVQVKCINEDNSGNVWIGTIKGIYVIDSNKKVVKHYTESNGLSNRFIYGILRDDDGNMWISHNKGISVYRTASNSFRHYTKEDGLQSNEFNTGAYFKAEDGTLFFGGINGTNGFYPKEITDNPNRPEVKITNIKLFDLPMKTDVAYWNVHTITLPYTGNSISFEFAALEYTDPGKNEYAYMMEGLDKDWINAGDKRFARYAAILPGQYVFKVKASNNDGKWQETPTTIFITIIPPYWQQLWFRILTVLFFIVAIAGTIVRIQRQRHKRQIRSLELQQKIQLERERISRDLHDTVGTQLSLISNNIDWVAHPVKEITENEKTEKLQFVNEAARDIIATLRETIWALNKEQIKLQEFSDKLKGFVQKQLAIYPQVKLNFKEAINATVILGPSEALNLFRICQEAIANSLKYAGATELKIKIETANDKYKVSIADNGKGFDLNSIDRLLQNGIKNMKYRAKDIGSEIEVKTGENEGTKITVTKK